MRHCESSLPTDAAYTDDRAANRRRLEIQRWLRAREADVADRKTPDAPKSQVPSSQSRH